LFFRILPAFFFRELWSDVPSPVGFRRQDTTSVNNAVRSEMRPGAIIVSVLTLLFALGMVVWLGQGTANVTVSQPETPKQAEEEKFPVPSPTGPHPKADFPEKKFDFGTQARYTKGSHDFVVWNRGEAPLELKSGASTCQCTVGKLGGEVVAPGESTIVTLSWEIKQAGPGFHHSATIHTNDPDNKQVQLEAQGYVGQHVAVFPDRWSLGTVGENDNRFEAYVYSNLHDGFLITQINSSNPFIQFEAEPMNQKEVDTVAEMLPTNEPHDPSDLEAHAKHPEVKAAYRITARVAEGLPVGHFREQVVVHTTLPDDPEVSVEFAGVRPGPFQFFPLGGVRFLQAGMLVDAGSFAADQGRRVEVLVIARGFDGELKISDVKADPDWVDVSLKPDADEAASGLRRYRMTLNIRPGLPRAVRTGENAVQISMKTNHPTGSILNLRMSMISE